MHYSTCCVSRENPDVSTDGATQTDATAEDHSSTASIFPLCLLYLNTSPNLQRVYATPVTWPYSNIYQYCIELPYFSATWWHQIFHWHKHSPFLKHDLYSRAVLQLRGSHARDHSHTCIFYHAPESVLTQHVQQYSRFCTINPRSHNGFQRPNKQNDPSRGGYLDPF